MPLQDFQGKMADQKLSACDSMQEKSDNNKFILRREEKSIRSQESW